MRTLLPMLLALCLVGCETEPEENTGGLRMLTPREQLTRLSVDLRGKHPSEAELVAFENDPSAAAWERHVDAWIAEPAFVDAMLEIFNQRYLTRTGESYFSPEDAGLTGEIDDRVLGDQVSEEPLALLRYVIENDLPYSHVITADHTMATPLLARFWDTDYPDGATGWQVARYQDDRPHAGILTMTTTWQKYPSMGGNANRHRANAVSKMFLCEDYLSRPIVLNRAAVDQLAQDPETAINENVGCQSCHSTLDPLAANFFGFFNYDDDLGIEQTVYRQENEQEWADYSGKPPGFYGRPTANLAEFSAELAADRRFIDCAVKTVVDGLTQRTTDLVDWSEVQVHTEAFVGSDQNLGVLAKSVLMDDSYRARGHQDEAVDTRLAGLKTVSPSQLASIIQDLTGYRWTFDGRDGLTKNDLGLPVLAGGIDSDLVVVPTRDPSVGTVFVQERLAQGAGWYVAAHDLDPARTEEARLLKYVTVEDTPDNNPEAFEAQIRYLYLAITGTALPNDATEPADLVAVWKYVHSVEASPTVAWGAVVSAVLRDPAVLFY